METLSVLKRRLTDTELNLIVAKTIEERSHIGSSLLYLADAGKVKESLRNFDYEGRLRVFYREACHGSEIILVGLLAYDVGYSWWSKKRILSEVFVFGLDPEFKGFGRVARKELDSLAKLYNCDVIIAGNFFMEKPAVMTNTYKKGGFEISCPTYTKVVGGLENG